MTIGPAVRYGGRHHARANMVATCTMQALSGLHKGRAFMASSEGYLEYVLDLLRDVPSVTCRKMMGEYLLYSEGILFGGVYDDRLLLKDVPAARDAFSEGQAPYEGAKPMPLVDSEDPAHVARVIAAMVPQLPKPKKRH